MGEREEIDGALARAPVRPLKAMLVRCVALQPLISVGKPDFLFTSGKPNRFNPAGVHCIYFAEDERTARAAYGRRLGGALNQPVATYFADVRLSRILDLSTRKARTAMGLDETDLCASWSRRKTLIRTQYLGLALSEQIAIAGIRFPSDAAREAGFAGCNVVIFPNAVRKPDSVRILGPTKSALQQWPESGR